MSRPLAALLVMVPLLGVAQDPRYAQAVSAQKIQRFEDAAPLFHALSEESDDPRIRGESEEALARAYRQLQLPVSSLITYAGILKAGPSHPGYLRAVEGLVALQEQLDEQNLVPTLITQAFTDEARQTWLGLPAEVLARVYYLVATIRHRQGRFEDARALLANMPARSRMTAKSQYLLGVVLADPRFPGRPDEAERLDGEAMDAFQSVVRLRNAETQLDYAPTRALALLGIGRIHYGRGAWAESSAAYEQVPRYQRFWDEALFENGFARFRNEDFGGALGSLQSLHAPQFAGAFQPESWILKATIYYYTCLYDEVRTTLGAFDAAYQPVARQLAPFAAPDVDPLAAFDAISLENNRRVPRQVALWIRNNERIQGVLSMIAQIDREKQALGGNPAWRGKSFATESIRALEENRATLLQVGGTLAKARFQEAAQNVRTFSDQAEIIRVQTALDEKDLYMSGIDQRRVLGTQSLYRPPMPGSDWTYWKFVGEFWIDELGYYQYTLKRGCLAKPGEE